MRRSSTLVFLLGLGAIMLALGSGYYFISTRSQPAAAAEAFKSDAEKDVFVRFDMEVYDIIMQNYWQKADDASLAPLFQLAAQKALGGSPALATSTREGTADMLKAALDTATSTDAKRDGAVLIAQVVLYNLAPAGRSALLTDAQQEQLRDEVANKPAQDLYQTLGVPKDASTTTIDAAYQAKARELAAATTSEAKAQLQVIQKAHEVLTSAPQKALYDTTGMQPTVGMRTIGTHTLYVDMSQVSPATFGEFVQELQAQARKTPLHNMIIDLRGNIGGTLDFAEYFLGLFLGPNSYAFDLYHQGDLAVQRTPSDIPKLNVLSHFTEVAVLIDPMTQSTAELMAASLKRFRIAHIVGQTSRGWGTVENTFPITSDIQPGVHYAVFLVHSLTLRDDNQPIQDRGVTPDVDISTSTWRSDLDALFPSSEMRTAIESLESKKTAQ